MIYWMPSSIQAGIWWAISGSLLLYNKQQTSVWSQTLCLEIDLCINLKELLAVLNQNTDWKSRLNRPKVVKQDFFDLSILL